jgi:hypothetical protein
MNPKAFPLIIACANLFLYQAHVEVPAAIAPWIWHDNFCPVFPYLEVGKVPADPGEDGFSGELWHVVKILSHM